MDVAFAHPNARQHAAMQMQGDAARFAAETGCPRALPIGTKQKRPVASQSLSCELAIRLARVRPVAYLACNIGLHMVGTRMQMWAFGVSSPRAGFA